MKNKTVLQEKDPFFRKVKTTGVAEDDDVVGPNYNRSRNELQAGGSNRGDKDEIGDEDIEVETDIDEDENEYNEREQKGTQINDE